MGGRPLDGQLVLDLGQVYNGPYCAFLLGQLGARVIKVEQPGGDIVRERVRGQDDPYPFLMLNSDKESVVLNLKDSGDRRLFLRLAEQADILIENFSVGVMERLGLSWEELHELNPRLVYGSSKGYGSEGPYSTAPAMDLTVQAMSGVLSATGYPDMPPTKAGPAISDFLAAVHLAAGVLAALFEREKTGAGSLVEVSMHEASVMALASALGVVADRPDREIPPRTGNRHPALSLAPYNVYPANDGFVAIICVTDRHWVQFAELLGGADLVTDARFDDTVGRAERYTEVDGIVSAWTRDKSRAEIVELLNDASVPCAPVLSAEEVYRDPHLKARGVFVELSHPIRGSIRVPGSPIRMGDNQTVPSRVAPTLGQHTDAVLAELCQVEPDPDVQGVER
ncbi:MAG: CoA transferase [Gemmatimonas sp.]|nr:CoA transferase [Gemmatimonas sp.]